MPCCSTQTVISVKFEDFNNKTILFSIVWILFGSQHVLLQLDLLCICPASHTAFYVA